MWFISVVRKKIKKVENTKILDQETVLGEVIAVATGGHGVSMGDQVLILTSGKMRPKSVLHIFSSLL